MHPPRLRIGVDMKTMRLSACASFVASLLAVAMTVTLSAQGADPFMGMWKMNVTKSTFSPGPAPKSGSVTFTAAGTGFSAVIEGVGAKDEKVRWEYTGAYGGPDAPVKGNPDGDMVSVSRISANMVQTTLKKAGKTTVVNTRTVSADGKTMTVTTKGTNAQGQAVHNVQVFEKSK